MKRWIQFNIDHSRVVLVIIIAVTVFSLLGLPGLHFDSSTEAMMPKDEPAYKMGERAKKVFGDTKTFMLTAIEPRKGINLLSGEVFRHLDTMVREIEEFKEFDLNTEDARLGILLKTGNIDVVPHDRVPCPEQGVDAVGSHEHGLDAEILGTDNGGSAGESLEAELDKEILEGGPAVSKGSGMRSGRDIWNIESPIVYDFYAEPLRPRNTYNYRKYRPVKIVSLREKLDSGGRRQLKTILLLHGMGDLRDGHRLSLSEFRTVLESWESAYLYKSMEIIKTFVNPISGEDIKGTAHELAPVDLVPEDDRGVRHLPDSKKDFEEYRQKLFNNPSFADGLYSRDRDGSIRALAMSIVLKPLKDHDEVFTYLYRLVMKYNTDPVVLTPVGVPVFQKFIREYMEKDLMLFMPIVLLVVILTFYLNFRMFRGVALPTVSVLLGTLWTMGAMGHLGVPVTMVVNMLPPLLVAVGSSYSIHIFNQYLHDHEHIHKQGKKYGLVMSMNHIVVTVVLAALTTFISFMTLSVNQVESLRHFGVFAALGTLIAMMISVMLIPAVLMNLKLLPVQKKKKGGEHQHANRHVLAVISLFSRVSLRRSGPVVIISAVLVVVFFYGLTRINVETGPLFYFKKNSYLYQSDLRISRLFNGSMVMNVIIDTGRTDGVKDPGFLKTVEEMRAWIVRPEDRGQYHQLHTLSFGDVVKRMHKAMNSDSMEYYVIPDTETTISEYLEIYSGDDRDSDGRVDTIEQFVDCDYRYLNVLVRIGTVGDEPMSTAINKKGIERIQRYIDTHPELNKYRYFFTGEIVNFMVLADLIVRGQVVSVLLTLCIVALVIVLLFKNWEAGLVAVIPISVSIIVVYGLMGFLGIPLDTAKALLSAIAIGIGVDDTIHMLKTLRHNIDRGLTIEQALTRTHREAGVAIVYTSLALILGFSVLMISGFMPVFYLGWLVSVTMIATTVSALVLLPAVVVLFKVPLNKQMQGGVFKYIHLDEYFNLNNDENN